MEDGSGVGVGVGDIENGRDTVVVTGCTTEELVLKKGTWMEADSAKESNGVELGGATRVEVGWKKNELLSAKRMGVLVANTLLMLARTGVVLAANSLLLLSTKRIGVLVAANTLLLLSTRRIGVLVAANTLLLLSTTRIGVLVAANTLLLLSTTIIGVLLVANTLLVKLASGVVVTDWTGDGVNSKVDRVCSKATVDVGCNTSTELVSGNWTNDVEESSTSGEDTNGVGLTSLVTTAELA